MPPITAPATTPTDTSLVSWLHDTTPNSTDETTNNTAVNIFNVYLSTIEFYFMSRFVQHYGDSYLVITIRI